jgi:hypothetical protein
MIVCCSCLTDCVAAVAANRKNSGYKEQKKGDDEEKFAVHKFDFYYTNFASNMPLRQGRNY